MITATGIGSGLDIDGLVNQLVAAERAGSDLQLNREGARINVELSAFSALKSSLATFDSSLSSLNDIGNYSKKTAVSADTNSIGVTATSAAVNSNYSVEVSQLANSHALASSGVVDMDTTALGTGTLSIRFGTTDYNAGTDTYNSFSLNSQSSTANITIDSSNNTLSGIMGAINDADIGASASIVNDGSGYRLLLMSKETGLANSMEIQVTDNDGNNTDTGGLSQFAFSAAATHMEQSSAGQDALFTVNGIAVSSDVNRVDSVIPGAVLDLKKVTTEPVSVTINEDTDTIVNAVNTFLAGYNKFRATVSSLTSYDTAKKVAGTLQGDFTVRSIVSQVDAILRNSVDGLVGDFTSMAELGINSDSDGNLKLDTTKFNEVLANNKQDVLKMFTAFGVPDDSDVSFKSAGELTQTGDYAINITQPATSGELAAAGVLPDFGLGGTVTIDATNDDFTIEVDGVDAGALQLTAGTYSTGEALAAEMQSQINGATALRDAGKTVSVTFDAAGSRLVITSDTVGNASTIDMLSVDSNMAADLGFSTGAGTVGQDVAGTIGGQSATGAGNLLTADAGTDAEGLVIHVDGMTTGARGNVSFTRGIGSQVSLYLEKLLDLDEGSIESRMDTLEDRKTRLDKRREDLNAKWEAIEARYQRKFNSLDSLLSSLQSTSSYLQTQLANLPKPNSVRGQ